MRLKEESLNCKCILTDEEKLEYARQQSLNIGKMQDLEAQKKQAVKQFDAEIAGCEASVSLTSQKINNGYEYRFTKCKIEYDWEAKTKEWLRPDGTVEKTDIIPDSELQVEAELE